MWAPTGRVAFGAAVSTCPFVGAPISAMAFFRAYPTLAGLAAVGDADLKTPKRDDSGDWAGQSHGDVNGTSKNSGV